MLSGKLSAIFILIGIICIGASALLWPIKSPPHAQSDLGGWSPPPMPTASENTSSTTGQSQNATKSTPPDRSHNTATPPLDPEPHQLVALSSSTIRRIDIAHLAAAADAPTLSLVQYKPDVWLLSQSELQPDVSPPSWPINPQRIHSFLRILSTLQGVPLAQPPADLTPIARLDFYTTQPNPSSNASQDKPAISLLVDGRSLGGRAIVTVQSAGTPQARVAYQTTDQLLKLFSSPTLDAWLDARPFALLGSPQSQSVQSILGTERLVSLSIESASRRFTLTRTGSHWDITEPFHVRAQDEVVAQTIASLISLGMTETHLLPVGASPTPADPSTSTTITLTTRRPEPQADGSIQHITTRHTLTTLGAPDATGGLSIEAHAADPSHQSGMPPRGPLFGPVEGKVVAQELLDTIHQPRVYIDRLALRANQSDVLALMVDPGAGTPLVWSRLTQANAAAPRWQSIEALTLTQPTAPEQPEPKAANKTSDVSPQINALLALLTHDQASLCEYVGQDATPRDFQPLATIECFGLGHLSIGRAQLGIAPLPSDNATPGPAYAVILRDGIARYYDPRETISLIRWIFSLNPNR